MENNVPEINFELTTLCVKHEVRKMPMNVNLIYETPEFGITKECRRQFGIHTLIGYWLWKCRMKKLWGKNGR